MRDGSKLIQSADYNRKSGGKAVRTVNPPLYAGSTVLFDNYEDLMLANSGDYDGIT